MSSLINHSLGRYHILEQLGEGGMATVYKAYDTRLERDVAIKIIRRNAFPPEQLERILKRFEREAKSLAKLSHPNIVGVLDYGEHEGSPYLVLVYLPGGTLKKLMGRPMPWQEAVRLLIPIANALEYAHEHKVVHRDVKPANILLTEKGQPMLTDFGIAKILELEDGHTLTGTGMGVGTPEYMSPEQGMGRDVDGRADIYSMGIIFYELITGRKPYTADTPMAVILKHMTDPLPRPSQITANLPEAVEKVLLKSLAKDPNNRYPDTVSFSAALENLVSTTQSPTTVSEKSSTVADDSAKTIDAIAVNPVTSKEINNNKKGSGQTIPGSGPLKTKPAISKGFIFGSVAIGLVAISLWIGSLLNPPSGVPTASEIPVVIESATSASVTPTPNSSSVEIIPENCVLEEVFCVGLVTDVGKINDRSFNQSAWEGVQKSQTDGVADLVQFIETSDAKDYTKNIATFGDAGFDVIVTVGFGLGEATAASAAVYPNIRFIGVDQFQSEVVPGVSGLNFPEDHAGFLVGALAAMMSKSHIIGAVCGTDVVPPVWRFGEGYKAGAAYADTLIGTATEVLIVYHSDVGFDKTFTDPEWGAQTAKSMINQGADAIFGCGGLTGNGAITAAAQTGAYAIGVDTDQYLTLPEAAPRMLSSALKLITPGVADLIAAAKDDIAPDGNIFGAGGYAPFHDLDGEVPAEIKRAMEEINVGLLDGSIKTNVTPAKP